VIARRIARRLARDERGTTLAEVVVGMAAGLTILVGLSTLTMVTLTTGSRVSARVHATQDSRQALSRVIDQLHSACIAPKVPPIREGSSSSELRFIHATGSAVSPVPTLTKITYSNGSLTQNDYAWKSGAAPFWTFNESTPVKTVLLASRIAPIGSKPIFTYYGYGSGAVSTTPLAVPLSTIDANKTIQVGMAFMANPSSGKAEDATPARIQGAASLRLTASSYNPSAPSYPCQ